MRSAPDYLDLRARNEVFTDIVTHFPGFGAIKVGERSRLTCACYEWCCGKVWGWRL